MDSLHEFKANLFRTLANPTRLRILELLQVAGSLTVGEIQQRLGVGPANVSQHLAVLRAQGLVATRREGTSVWYRVRDPEVYKLLETGTRIFERQVQAHRDVLDASRS